MLGNNKKIDSGDNSTNNQAETIHIHNYGLSLGDVEGVVNRLIENSFLVLKEEASLMVKDRVTEFTEKLIERLKEEPEESLNEFANPGMQDSLYNAQKEFAMSGDPDLADMLVEILAERASTTGLSKKRIILDESLKVAPKLTGPQMDLLLLGHFTYQVAYPVANLNSLLSRLSRLSTIVEPLDIESVNSDLSFLEYLRLGKIVVGKYPSIEAGMKGEYPALFSKGFNLEEFHVDEIASDQLLIPCFHDHTRYQLKFGSKESGTAFLRSSGFPEERIESILTYFGFNAMSDMEIKTFLIDKVPHFSKLYEFVEKTQLSSFELSGVGVAIALSNYHRQFGEKNDISIFVK